MRKSRKNEADGKLTKTLLRLRVNGEFHEVATEINKTLLEVLREDMALTGTKHGCELGECGTCSVLVDGKPVLSCLLLGIEAVNAEIVTVEGMMQNGKSHALQKAFADLGAAQCGYCIPGILLTAKALLDEIPEPEPRPNPASPVGKSLPLHGLHKNLASGRTRGEGNHGMTLLTRLATSAIRKSPLFPLCQRENLYSKRNFPSLKKRGQGRFWTRVIG